MRKSYCIRATIAAILIICANACVRVQESDFLVGQPIRFAAATEYFNGPGTRTAYSGEMTAVGGKSYERINWVSGDMIRVYSPNAHDANSASVHYADYTVKGISGSGTKSTAAIEPVGQNGLVWGSGTDGNKHSFFCVYPSPASNDGQTPPVSMSGSIAVDGSGFSGVVPSTQVITWDGNTGKPDMQYAYMLAAATDITPQTTVNLYFKPMVTVFQFQVSNPNASALLLNSFRLTSTAAVAGPFSATLIDPQPTGAESESVNATAIATFDCSAAEDTAIEISLGNHSLAPDETATFTVFALPKAIENVTIEIYTGENGETRRALALKQNGEFVSFPACQKAYINHMGIPGAWTYHMDRIDPIILEDESVMTDLDSIVTVHTYKSVIGMNDVPVGWKMYFTTENPSGKDKISDFSSIKETPYTTNEARTGEDAVTDKAYLSSSATTGNGDHNNVTITIGESPLPPANPSEVVINEAGVKRHYANHSNPDVGQLERLRGRQYTNLDLSTYDFVSKTSGLSSETANCYIIDGYGSFKIPLVYGNAIRLGAPNTSAYKRSGNSSDYLNTFLNAEGNPIQSPYILEDAGLTNKSGDYSGRVVWQDTRYGYEIVRDENISIDGNYMTFSINREDLKPGNVIIALYDNVQKMILWSWHLWIFGEDFYTRNVSRNGRTVSFLSVNLGWAAPLKYPDSKTDGRKQYAVIAVNDGTINDGTVLGSFEITQKVYTVPGAENDFYSGTFYQFGNKNPYLPLSSGSMKHCKFNTTAYPEYRMNSVDPLNRSACEYHKSSNGGDRFNIQGCINTVGPLQDLVFSIQNPSIFIKGYAHIAYRNAWNVTFNNGEYNLPIVKSIYDPCPRGFAVPRSKDFLVLIDPARDGTTTSVYETFIARGFGRVDESGMHEIFGEEMQPSSDHYGGFRFYTDDGNDDLEFRWGGYRGGISADSQPNYGGYVHSADRRPTNSIPVNENTGTVTREGSSLFIYTNAGGNWIGASHSAALYTMINAWGIQVRPVADPAASTDIGASSTGQGVENHDAGGMNWE